ncbi:LLM class flavin-dependent oxidoreductase [Dactylosporangium darangshiense]|uniref:LLM class flavin-dependent oxidoreductase n=1 Tax=Dactylosporangium darangshiense TaxID=579108 RepID=UPI00362D5A67
MGRDGRGPRVRPAHGLRPRGGHPGRRGAVSPPFYEPFTTLAWLAGNTRTIGLGTTVLITPYRHPLLTARMAANLGALSGGRLVLGVGVGWAREEFAALGVPFEQRGRLTDRYLDEILAAWKDERDYPGGGVPLWIGGNSDAGLRRAVRLGAPWHPLRFTLPWFRAALARLAALAEKAGRPVPALTPRIILRITDAQLDDARRLTGEGSLAQILADLTALRELGADTVVLDPFGGDPAETLRPERAWRTSPPSPTPCEAHPRTCRSAYRTSALPRFPVRRTANPLQRHRRDHDRRRQRPRGGPAGPLVRRGARPRGATRGGIGRGPRLAVHEAQPAEPSRARSGRVRRGEDPAAASRRQASCRVARARARAIVDLVHIHRHMYRNVCGTLFAWLRCRDWCLVGTG